MLGFLAGDSGMARLTITAYEALDCTGPKKTPSFIAQTNPQEISYTFKIDNGGDDKDAKENKMPSATGNSASPPVFQGYTEMNLKFEILADATGIVPIPDGLEDYFYKDGSAPSPFSFGGGTPSIKPYLDLLQDTVYSYQEKTHGPPYLELVWGNIFPDSSNADGSDKPAVFKGQLIDYSVDITLFSVQGEPIKAKIKLNIKSLIDPSAKPLGSSPDLTHHIPISHGDKMTTHCNDIYGRYDSKICSAVAEYNNMIDWDLNPGTQMTFPSIHLLNELYLDKYEDVEIKPISKETEKEQMVDLIGEKKAEQYFKMFPIKEQKIEA